MSGWFTDLPPTARGGLVIGGGLLGAFSGQLPDYAQMAGLYLGIAAVSYGFAATIWHWLSKRGVKMGLAQTILLLSLIGLGVSAVGAVTAGAWILIERTPLPLNDTKSANEGPLSWINNLWMTGGGIYEVRSLTFKGANVSQNEVRMESADITSAINGRRMPLQIVVSDGEKSEIVPLDRAELIPPGARIELIAQFDPPMPPKEFLETWRQFYFNVKDDSRTYRSKYDENFMGVFFPGAIGPRVTKKPEPALDPEIANDPNNRDRIGAGGN